MAWVEDFSVYFTTLGVPATLAGTAVRGLLNTEAADDGFGVVTQTPSFLLQPTTAVVPAAGQALVCQAITYTVRQVLREPPDGTLQRLVLARA
jgi:hypothetical protein